MVRLNLLTCGCPVCSPPLTMINRGYCSVLARGWHAVRSDADHLRPTAISLRSGSRADGPAQGRASRRCCTHSAAPTAPAPAVHDVGDVPPEWVLQLLPNASFADDEVTEGTS
jgi:hypothetical protein